MRIGLLFQGISYYNEIGENVLGEKKYGLVKEKVNDGTGMLCRVERRF